MDKLEKYKKEKLDKYLMFKLSGSMKARIDKEAKKEKVTKGFIVRCALEQLWEELDRAK